MNDHLNDKKLNVYLFELLDDIKDVYGEFKLIIREDGSGLIKDLDGKCLYDFDTLVEMTYKFMYGDES